MNYESGKKLSILGTVGGLIILLFTYVLNIVLLMTNRESIMADPMGETMRINGMVNNIRMVGYIVSWLLVMAGFVFMFMEEREINLLLTAASVALILLNHLLRLFGFDLSPLGITNALGLNEGIGFVILFILISAAYSLYLVFYALQAFKMGNTLFGIILALIVIWNIFGNVIITVIQSFINAFGVEVIAMFSGIINIATLLISIIIEVIKIIHLAKNY